MSRPPTPAEIMATNPNMTLQCSKCYLVQNANSAYGTFENMLTINMSGGYGEYVDSAFLRDEELEFYLCHECAHLLMKTFFGDWNLSGWHPRTEDKYCDGWEISDHYEDLDL